VPFFVVRNERGPAWDWTAPAERQRFWGEHVAFLQALEAERFVVAGSAIGQGRHTGTVQFVEADGPATVRSRLGSDPWVRAGILRVVAIEPWTIVLGGLGAPPT
jgi:uncharacterized protein YciI